MTDDMTDDPKATPDSERRDSRRRAAAARALDEAAARRGAYAERERALAAAREIDGRKGPEPVRYGDWERKGLASDF